MTNKFNLVYRFLVAEHGGRRQSRRRDDHLAALGGLFRWKPQPGQETQTRRPGAFFFVEWAFQDVLVCGMSVDPCSQVAFCGESWLVCNVT